MERILRGTTYAIGGLVAGMIAAGIVSQVLGEWIYPTFALLLFGAGGVAGFRFGYAQPTKGQSAPSPTWARSMRVTLAVAAAVVEVVLTVVLRDEGGFAVFSIVGLVLAVLLIAGVAAAHSRRNAITLLAPVWIIEVVALSGFIFPGLFVAAPTLATTIGALLPDGNASIRRERRSMTPERWALYASVGMIAVGVTSLLWWWTAA